jgi:hypothetical protein
MSITILRFSGCIAFMKPAAGRGDVDGINVASGMSAVMRSGLGTTICPAGMENVGTRVRATGQ